MLLNPVKLNWCSELLIDVTMFNSHQDHNSIWCLIHYSARKMNPVAILVNAECTDRGLEQIPLDNKAYSMIVPCRADRYRCVTGGTFCSRSARINAVPSESIRWHVSFYVDSRIPARFDGIREAGKGFALCELTEWRSIERKSKSRLKWTRHCIGIVSATSNRLPLPSPR